MLSIDGLPFLDTDLDEYSAQHHTGATKRDHMYPGEGCAFGSDIAGADAEELGANRICVFGISTPRHNRRYAEQAEQNESH